MHDTIDKTRPTSARIYDYMLGGSHHFEPDRRVADQILAAFPQARSAAQVNRGFLRRSVRWMVAQGIQQFLDIGSGIPATGNVHEIAQSHCPAARILYVDIDPVAVAHGVEILADNHRAAIIQGDLRQLSDIFAHPEARRLLDLSQPIGLLCGAVFHFFADDAEVRSILDELRQRMAAGSVLALSHSTFDGVPLELTQSTERLYASFKSTLRHRSRAEVEALFCGLELVEPGVVYSASWRPDSPEELFVKEPALSHAVAGVARKR